MERFTGTLNGRKEASCCNNRNDEPRRLQLSITVVPDSGTGELVGITGKMAIIIADGKHSYDFEYTLPEQLTLRRNPDRLAGGGATRSEKPRK